MSPISPGAWNSFGFPWTSSWSSPAPHKEPESASPSGERLQGLRAEGPGSQSAPMSPPSPVKGMGAQIPHMVKLWKINTLRDVQNLPDSQGASRLARGPRQGKGDLGALEQHLLDVLMRRVEELT